MRNKTFLESGVNTPFPLFLLLFTDPLCEYFKDKNLPWVIPRSPVPNTEQLLGKYLSIQLANNPLGTVMNKVTIIPILITFIVECKRWLKIYKHITWVKGYKEKEQFQWKNKLEWSMN